MGHYQALRGVRTTGNSIMNDHNTEARQEFIRSIGEDDDGGGAISWVLGAFMLWAIFFLCFVLA